VRTQRPQQPGTDPGHPIEALEAAESPLGIPIGYNGLGQRKTHPRQASELGGLRHIRVNHLARRERPCLVHGTVALRRWGTV